MNFLPKDFDTQQSIVLLAGKGMYPQLVWERLSKTCPNASLFCFEEEVKSWAEQTAQGQHSFFSIGQVGTWLKALKKCSARYVLLAGQITPKKLFQGLNPDLKAILLLASLKEKNASTIFGALIKEIEKLDIRVLDARCFLEDQLASPGNLTKTSAKLDPEQLQKSIDICKQIAALDVGQGIVVSNGTVIAVEAFEGTDAMIERAGTLCKRPMGLIKLAKQTQDFRFDVPVFGPRTLKKMMESGLTWAALESHRTLILEKERVLEEADRQNIAIFGF
ncbi:MAG: LpxI family protein [Opitutales bacterium]